MELNLPPYPKLKYWYRTNIKSCVICGHENIDKERVYNESEKGISWGEKACFEHFI